MKKYLLFILLGLMCIVSTVTLANPISVNKRSICFVYNVWWFIVPGVPVNVTYINPNTGNQNTVTLSGYGQQRFMVSFYSDLSKEDKVTIVKIQPHGWKKSIIPPNPISYKQGETAYSVLIYGKGGTDIHYATQAGDCK